MIVRLRDWPERLMRFVDETREVPFEWSWQDCAVWPLRAIDAMCGSDIAGPIRGQYGDWDGAVAYCRGRGWETLADAAREICGPAAPRLSHLRRGDVMAFPSRTDLLPGEFHPPLLGVLRVAIGADQLASPIADGLRIVSAAAAMRFPGVLLFPVGGGA